jgi:hypothetical protein
MSHFWDIFDLHTYDDYPRGRGMIHYINNTNIDALAQCFTVAITRVRLSQIWDFTVQLSTAFASLYNLCITYGYNIVSLHRGCWDAEVGRARGWTENFLALRALMVDLDTELWHLA